jgi:hypothetical protein
MQVVYDPRTIVWHRRSATSGGTSEPLVRFLAQRNRLLCLARNAPVEVARRFIWQRVMQGPNEGVRRAVLRKLPWALMSRAQLHRLWVTTPRSVWDRWAGADNTWAVQKTLEAG